MHRIGACRRRTRTAASTVTGSLGCLNSTSPPGSARANTLTPRRPRDGETGGTCRFTLHSAGRQRIATLLFLYLVSFLNTATSDPRAPFLTVGGSNVTTTPRRARRARFVSFCKSCVVSAELESNVLQNADSHYWALSFVSSMIYHYFSKSRSTLRYAQQ